MIKYVSKMELLGAKGALRGLCGQRAPVFPLRDDPYACEAGVAERPQRVPLGSELWM